MSRSASLCARVVAGSLLMLAGLGLSACQKDQVAPADAGVCYRAVIHQDRTAEFVALQKNVARIEDCAAILDQIRFRFLSMGSTRHEIVGAFQGRFLFIDGSGLSYAESLNGNQYPALGRLPDGRLAVPGLMPQGPAPKQP